MSFILTAKGLYRPKLRWFDDVQTDIRTLGIKRWMYKEQDRLKWARITREAKVKDKGL